MSRKSQAPVSPAAPAKPKAAKPAQAPAEDLASLLARAMQVDPSIRGQILMALNPASPVIARHDAAGRAARVAAGLEPAPDRAAELGLELQAKGPAKPKAAKPAQAPAAPAKPAFVPVVDQIAAAKRDIASRAKQAQAPQAPAEAQAPAAPAVKRTRKAAAPAAPAKLIQTSGPAQLSERFAIALGRAASRAWTDITNLDWYWMREAGSNVYVLQLSGENASRAAQWAAKWLAAQPDARPDATPVRVASSHFALRVEIRPDAEISFG